MACPSIDERWLRLTEETNALDYLEQAYHYIGRTETHEVAWKWVVLTLHGALYGFATCAVKGTNQDRVVDFKRRNEVSEELDELPLELRCRPFPQSNEIRYNPNKRSLIVKGAMSLQDRRELLGLSRNESYQKAINRLFEKSRRLIGFDEALRRCQDPKAMRMTVMSRNLHLSDRQKRSIGFLRREFRNKFEHYMPALWWIELHGMPEIAMDVLDVIRFLALETGNYVNLNGTQRKRVKSIVFQSKRILRQNRLYREAKLLDETPDKSQPL